MPRRKYISAKELQESRGNWYVFHFEHKKLAYNLPAGTISTVKFCLEYIPPPTLTIYGGLPHDWPPRIGYALSISHDVNIHLLNPWYISEEGWKDFQRLWANLPEPIETVGYPQPRVQIDQVIHTVHKEDRLEPPM